MDIIKPSTLQAQISDSFRKEVKMPNSYKHRSGDRKEGRLLRSLPASRKFIPYSQPDRDGASFFLDEDLDVTEAENASKLNRTVGMKALDFCTSLSQLIYAVFPCFPE